MNNHKYFRYKPLPDVLFKVRVPLIATQTEYNIKRGTIHTISINESIGFNADSDLNLDMCVLNQPTLVMLKLSRIIDLHMKGYYVTVVNPDDVVKIYNLLEDYYSGSATETEEIFNVEVYEDERIPFINDFLTKMFNEHKEAIARSKINLTKNSLLLGNGFINRRTDFSKRKIVENPKPTGLMKGYSIGYMEDDIDNISSERPTVNSNTFKEEHKKDNEIKGLYVNHNIPKIDTDYIKSLKRPNRRPGIDLNQFRK